MPPPLLSREPPLNGKCCGLRARFHRSNSTQAQGVHAHVPCTVMVHVHVQSVPELRECLTARRLLETRDSKFLLAFCCACCIPGTCRLLLLPYIENGTAIRLAKIFRAGKVRSMRTWTVYYKSCRDVNHIFITLVHVYTELVRRYTEHVR